MDITDIAEALGPESAAGDLPESPRRRTDPYSPKRPIETRPHAAAARFEPSIADSLLARSPAMRAFARSLERVVLSDATVCLLGESGVGKEVAARTLHERGRRARGPFVAINCAAIPQALQESELFGHEKGAFTGAVGTYKGRFEQAASGTLFLDEVGEMSPALQASLLRALQERTIRRVGGAVDIAVDVRIICATHRDLEAEVAAGRFRQDLYFRLVVYPARVPPLRERPEDIPGLVRHFLVMLSGDVGRAIERVSPEALDALLAHPWNGNVRELQNVLHRAMLSAEGDEIELADLPSELRARVLPTAARHLDDAHEREPERFDDPIESLLGPEGFVPTLASLERRAIDRALRATRGHIGRAAQLLGIGRTTLYRRLHELKIATDAG